MTHSRPDAAVVGGGISGLAAAWYLMQRGVPVTLYERSGRAGGSIKTHREGNWLVDEGPNTLLVRSRRTWDLIDSLGLSGEVTEAPSHARNRYIVKGGDLEPLPTSIGSLMRSRLFSLKAKGNLLLEPFRARGEDPEESIASFMERRLGREVVDYAVDPFVAGVHAGDPDRLSVRHALPKLWNLERDHGSLIRGAVAGRGGEAQKRSLLSFRSGMAALPEALARALGERLRYEADVESVTPEGGRWKLKLEGEGEYRQHDTVVLACPAATAADLLAAVQPEMKRALNEISCVPVSVLATGFRRDAIRHPLDGFGMLIPKRESGAMLGTLFSSSLFPGRAPRGYELLTSFAGGARQPGMAADDTGTLLDRVLPDLRRLLGITGDPDFVMHHHWPAAIPQYECGYGNKLESIERLERTNSGLWLCGNYRGGISVPDCIASGERVAAGIVSRLNNGG